MAALAAFDAMAALRGVFDALAEPIVHTLADRRTDTVAGYSFWRDFVLREICDDRLMIVWALPVGLALLLAPPRRLRPAIVATGLVFLGYLFGALYALFWLLTCWMFFRLGEVFARESAAFDAAHPPLPDDHPRRDWPRGPVWGAILLVTGWYLGVQAMQHIPLPETWNAWLFKHARWLFGYGWRAWAWEPYWGVEHARPQIAQLFATGFYSAHLIGTAYLAMRMLHYFSELRLGRIAAERRTLLNFLAWLCYAPNVMQGPIERYPRFQEELDTCFTRRSWRNAAPAVGRISMGIAKSLIVTWYFTPILFYTMGLGNPDRAAADRYYKRPEEIESLHDLFFGVFFNIFALYLEFSGYCDISAGIARLLGYRQVENFQMPWLATSLRDFWRRWHISLSALLRDYLYIAVGGNRRHVTFNLCFTFAVCGLWHAPIPKVGLWGLLMGAMLAVNQAWVQWMEKLDAAPGGALPAIRRAWLKCRPLPQIAAWLFTQQMFVFSLLLFFGGSAVYRVPLEILRRLWRMWVG